MNTLDEVVLFRQLMGLPIAPAMTSDEINEAATAEWLGIIESLWVAIGKPTDADRLRLYAKVLRFVPLGLLEKAIYRLLLETTYQVVPTLAQVIAAVNKELADANCEGYDDWILREFNKHDV